MEQHLNPNVPPKACPICSVAMQATETKERIVHRCDNCGMSITIVLPVTKDK
jgi:DNA-directed RNA polymerase subunit M/transcription elongation factor TFIIS